MVPIESPYTPNDQFCPVVLESLAVVVDASIEEQVFNQIIKF
jgi:hypothetical protein